MKNEYQDFATIPQIVERLERSGAAQRLREHVRTAPIEVIEWAMANHEKTKAH